MTLDKSGSYRKGSVIVEVHAQIDENNDVIPSSVLRTQTDYGTINKAKKANRQTQYRVVRK
jgi:hypothetical protein